MSRPSAMAMLAVLSLGGTGCVQVHQLLKMQHDGSGTMIETITVKPRALRLIEKMEKSGGKKDAVVQFLSDEALQVRAKAFGGVTVKEKKVSELPDGSKQLQVEYAFPDVNKVSLYAAPLFRCNDKNSTGQIKLSYQRLISWDNPKRYFKADVLSLRLAPVPKQSVFSTPAVAQEYRQVTPIFLEMVKEARFRIEIQAPDDVEEFEKGRDPMVKGMSVEGNKVLAMNLEGADVIGSSEVMRGFIQGEVGADWETQRRTLPNTTTPWDRGYHGEYSVRFLKLAEVPAPSGAEETQKDPKK